MSRFVNTTSNGKNAINLGTVGRAEPMPRTIRGVEPTRLVDDRGAEAAILREPLDLETLTAPVIAAGEPVHAVFVTASGVTHSAIVGWRIGRHGAEPLFVGGQRPSGEMFVATAKGFVGRGECFKTVAEVQRAIAEEEEEEAA